MIHLQGKVPSQSTHKITVSDDSRLNDNDIYQDCELLSGDEFFDAREIFYDKNNTIYMDSHEREEELAVPRQNTEQNMESDSDIGPMGYEDIL